MIPLIPEAAPFSAAQRAWLNGFFAGAFGLAPTGGAPAAAPPPAAVEEEFPWHDPALPMPERLALAEGKPLSRRLMAAMAQLDCGACGYLCDSYSEAIAAGAEPDLTKCSPGGKETAKKLRELAAERKSLPATVAGGAAPKAVAPVDPSRFDRANPFPAPLLRAEPLTRAGSEKDVRLVALSLKGSGLEYEVGDALGVWPENDPELVEQVLAALGARGDEWVPAPGGGRAHAYDALLRSYSLTKVAAPFAEVLAKYAAPAEAETLRTLLDSDDGVPDGWDVLDLLAQFPSARGDLAEVVGALAPLSPRLYSISSSLKAHPGEVHLTVGAVRYSHGGRARKGVASDYLCARMRPRQKAGVFVHHSPNFRLPAAGDTPVIMVGPGTGVAPFRAFLQERAAAGAAGPNWLLFGNTRRDCDYLYEAELAAYSEAGVLARLDAAFSRDSAQKVYVQHKMREAGRELFDWLERGAYFYVCGDARRMAPDVDAALHAVVAEAGGKTAEAATEYVRALSKAGRYRRDVY